MATIYLITNLVNGKNYVGKTSLSLQKRMEEHLKEARKTRAKDRKLYMAINEFGEENFSIKPLSKDLTEEEAWNREVEMISLYDTFNNGYNMTIGGSGKTFALTSSKEKERLSNLYRQGLSLKGIALEVGADAGTVRRRLSDIGFHIPRGGVSTPMRQEIHVIKEGESFYFISGANFAEYIIENKLSSGKRNSVTQGVNRLLNGSRQSYLGFKLVK